MNEHKELHRLIDVVKKLRDPQDGCPWDLKQTHLSLLKYLIEESYEYIHAVEENDDKEMEEELGDVLLQVLLHSVIAEQDQRFNLESVSKKLADKLIFRHPHVFSETKVKDAEEVVSNWEELKKEEKGEVESEIDDSYLKFPSLFSSYKIGKKTKKLLFDWENASQVAYKVEEEWQELKEELAVGDKRNQQRVSEEMGDFLFSAAQLARHLDLDPEQCLRDSNKKFLRRFRSMEALMKKEGAEFGKLEQKELDVFWDEAKRREKSNKA